MDRGDEPGVKEHAADSDKNYFDRPRLVLDPSLLALHRALCGVLHLSCAAEVIDEAFMDAGNASIEIPSSKVRIADELDLLFSTLSLVPH